MAYQEEIETFTVTQGHIMLLKRMFVGWQDCEYGAPEINPKRPYGNSNVPMDIAEILGWDYPDEDKMSPGDFDAAVEVIEEKARKIHKEMKIVLQILLNNACIIPETYSNPLYSNNWKIRPWSNNSES